MSWILGGSLCTQRASFTQEYELEDIRLLKGYMARRLA
jgi:hypothetical protein